MPKTIKLTKTIALKSKPLTKTKIKIIENTIESYKEVLSIALDFGLKIIERAIERLEREFMKK